MTGEEPVKEGRLPHQGRAAWTDELRALLKEARLRGDTRPQIVIIDEWLTFRRQNKKDGDT